MTTDITELAQSLKAAAEKATQGNWRAFQYHDGRCGIGGGHHDEIMVCEHISKERQHDAMFIALANPANVLALVEALEKAQQRNAELEAQNDYFASLVAMARVSADKAIRKFPQPNYVLLKVAEEAGEVVQAGVHYAENRMEWVQVEGEIVQLLAMLIRLVTEGDQVNGITPPALCSAGIKVEAE
ncbi:TPA: ead/Ea22-like family protein [Raoultella ornithinolytica]